MASTTVGQGKLEIDRSSQGRHFGAQQKIRLGAYLGDRRGNSGSGLGMVCQCSILNSTSVQHLLHEDKIFNRYSLSGRLQTRRPSAPAACLQQLLTMSVGPGARNRNKNSLPIEKGYTTHSNTHTVTSNNSYAPNRCVYCKISTPLIQLSEQTSGEIANSSYMGLIRVRLLRVYCLMYVTPRIQEGKLFD